MCRTMHKDYVYSQLQRNLRHYSVKSGRRMFTPATAFGTAMLLCAQTASAFDRTNCEQFGMGARFDPFEVVDSMWKIFYYWANHTEVSPVAFALPVKKDLEDFKSAVSTSDNDNVKLDWSKAVLIMTPNKNTRIILIKKIDSPTTFHAVIVRMKKADNIFPTVHHSIINMKMVGRYIGLMACEEGTAYAMARLDEIPEDHKLAAAAATIGYEGPWGRPYKVYSPPVKEEL